MATNRSFGHMLRDYVAGDKMPFKSEKQKLWMYINKPDMAKKWSKESVWKSVKGK